MSKTIVAGGRTYQLSEEDYKILDNAGISEIVCGGAKGADQCGKEWAKTYEVPVKMFPADWNTHGKAAGPIRNKQMAEYADSLIAFWDGKSRGTKNMIETAKKLKLNVEVVMIEPTQIERPIKHVASPPFRKQDD